MSDERSKVKDYIEKKLIGGKRLASDDEALFTNGAIDSFGVLELIAFLETAFKIQIDTRRHDLKDFDTVNKIMVLVGRLQNEYAKRA